MSGKQARGAQSVSYAISAMALDSYLEVSALDRRKHWQGRKPYPTRALLRTPAEKKTGQSTEPPGEVLFRTPERSSGDLGEGGDQLMGLIWEQNNNAFPSAS